MPIPARSDPVARKIELNSTRDTPKAIRQLGDRSQRDYWLCQLGGWGLLAVYAVASTPLRLDSVALRFIVVKLLCVVTAFSLSTLWRRYLCSKRWLHRNQALPFGRIVIGLLLLAIGQTALLLMFDTWLRFGTLLHDAEVKFLLGALAALWFALFSVWTLCYAAILSRRRAGLLELQTLELEVSAKDTELRALQAQINPHFFFNSLNSISALIFQDPAGASRAIGQLAGMMRYSLESGQLETVSLAQEMHATEAYLGVEKIRFEERLALSIDIAPGLASIRLPPMALQTLVENAIKYGVERSLGPCRVSIEARRTGALVTLQVTNQGELAEASASTRIGLANTRKRLALIFGPRATCTLEQRDGCVIARMQLPSEPA